MFGGRDEISNLETKDELLGHFDSLKILNELFAWRQSLPIQERF